VNAFLLFNLMIDFKPGIRLKSIQLKLMIAISLGSLLHSTLDSIINLRHVNLWTLLLTDISRRFFDGVGMKAWYSAIADFIRLAATSN